MPIGFGAYGGPSLKQIEALLDKKFRQFALDVKTLEDRADDLHAVIKDLEVSTNRLSTAVENLKNP